MGGSRGGGGNSELNDLQKRALEEELEEKDRLEADLEARRRLRTFGGRRGQLRFLGPLARQVRRSEERGQTPVTPATPSQQGASTTTRSAGESGRGQSRGRIGERSRDAGEFGSGRDRPTQSDPGAFDTGGSVFG